MDISIIIVNYRTPELTIDCINSVYEHTRGLFFEIILVDNCSNDGSLIKIADRFDKVIIIESESNLGFGKANNLGAKFAKGKYLFLLNPDTILHNNACLFFFEYLSNHGAISNLGALGCVMIDSEGNNNYLNSFHNFPSVTTYLKDKLLGFLNYRNGEDFYKKRLLEVYGHFDVDYIVGADLFIRADVFDLLGGFDERFFMYWEEVDLQFRMRSKGFISKIISGPVISHLEGGASVAKGNIWKRNQDSKSLLLFVYLNYSKTKFRLFKMAFYLIFVFQFIRFKYTLREELEFLKNINKKLL